MKLGDEQLAALALGELPERKAREVRAAAAEDQATGDLLGALEATVSRLRGPAMETPPAEWVEACVALHARHARRAAALRGLVEYFLSRPVLDREMGRGAAAAHVAVEDPVAASTRSLGDLLEQLALPVIVEPEHGVFLYWRDAEIVGVLASAEGHPLSAVAVDLGTGEGEASRVLSSPTGMVLLPGVPAGSYRLAIGSPLCLVRQVLVQ